MSVTQKSPPSAQPQLPPPKAVAKLDFTVRRFRPPEEGNVEADMKLTNPSETVEQPNADTILVHRDGARLEITASPSTSFRAVDVMFQEKSTGKPVPIDGGGPFKHKVPGTDNVQVDDTFPMPPAGTPPSAKKYKFSVIVERRSDHKRGIIDPDLENEN